MKLPLSWLNEWVRVPWRGAELAHRLTMLGFEVEAMGSVAPPFTGVVVAELLEVTPHPQADKLRVCRVKAGGSELQIVCGAPNARNGLRSALAVVGAQLPNDLTIKAAKLRGIESQGMLCSAVELGLQPDNDGIIELPADAPVGADLRQYLDLDDIVLDIAITPNRGDAMSVLGIAREIAAATGQALMGPATQPVAGADPARFAVTLAPGTGAGRFASRVMRGVDNTRATAAWMRERLQRAGLRSISPVVDVTNYVLLELGQPMHAYDLAKLRGGITVRRAATDEPVRLLDGRDLKLANDVLVIADQVGVVGLAGVMGGERTAISATTRDLVLEVAWFSPAAVAGRARRYGLLTDASQRFERGVDPAGQARALERATQLIGEVTGGIAGPADLQELPDQMPVRKPVPLRARRLERLLGMPVSGQQVQQQLQSLGMQVTGGPDNWQVTPPSWRFDVTIEADLIEELARVTGLDNVPESPLVGPRHIGGGSESQLPERTLLQLLAARGYHESISFGFVDPALQRQLLGERPAIALKNPIASDLAVMRASLWPGLIQALLQNHRRQQERVRLFEIANRFLLDANGSTREQRMVSGVAMGTRLPEQWGAAKQPLDFFDVKADVEALLAAAGPQATHRFEPAADAPPGLHPGRCATIVRGGQPIGLIGELHPLLVRSFDLTYTPLLFELDYQAVAGVAPATYTAISSFPQIRRDISFTVSEAEAFSAIIEHVSVAASTRLKELRIFDVYQGKGVESGRKSVALGLILQDLSRTLTDKEADDVVAAVLERLRSKLNARLRE